jgi:hypothetical protein
MITIWNILQLRSLEVIARRYGIAFTLRGGVAFRLSTIIATRPPLDMIDLFDLIRPMSDIDLMHSGSKDITTVLLDEIMKEVPSAECFQWELHTENEVRQLLSGNNFANLIPARMIEFTENFPDGLVNRAGGYDDVANGSYRYFRHPRFRESVRYRNGLDLEVFSALLYLQTLAQANVPVDRHDKQPGWQAVKEVFLSSKVDADLIRMLQEYPYLRSRLRHLLIATATSYSDRKIFREVAHISGLSECIKIIAGPSGPLRLENCLSKFFGGDGPLPQNLTLVDSDRLSGDVYRLQSFSMPWAYPKQPNAHLPHLGEGQTLLLISPELTIHSGNRTEFIGSLGTASEQSVSQVVSSQEFVMFSLPEEALLVAALHSTLANSREEDLSAFIIMREEEEEDRWSPFAVPAIVHKTNGPAGEAVSLSIKMNCLGLLAAVTVRTSVRAHVALVTWKRGVS